MKTLRPKMGALLRHTSVQSLVSVGLVLVFPIIGVLQSRIVWAQDASVPPETEIAAPQTEIVSSLTEIVSRLTETVAPQTEDASPKTENVSPQTESVSQQPPAATLDDVLVKPGSIQLRDATLADWIFAIQAEWKINIVAGGELQKETVSGAFTNAPLRDILNAILYTRGYGYQEVANSLLVMKLDDIGVIKPQSELAIIPLIHLSPTDAEPTVRLLLSPNGTVQSIPSSKSVFVIDLPERISKVREHLRALEDAARESHEREQQRVREEDRAARARQMQDQLGTEEVVEAAPEQVEVFEPQFLNAENLAETVQSVIGGDARVTVVTDENQLVVIGPEKAIRTAAALINRMDVPRPQVRITALLYDVDLEVMERFGFNWAHGGNARGGRSVASMNSSFFADPMAVSSGGDGGASAGAGDVVEGAATAAAASAFGGLTKLAHSTNYFNLDAVILALDQTEGSRLLARPTIMAYDRVEAEIKIISEVPVQSLTETDMGGSIGTTEFREAGVTLTVTPEVKKDGRIKLALAPEFSVLAGFAEGQPIIDRRSTTTEVHVVNGQTFVIGGLLRRSELETVRGIPGLMHWKYFGKLFRDHDTTVTESELVIFIKTEIVDLGYMGEPREQMAGSVGMETVERIPFASHEPFIPPCNDPYCPYHNPRTVGGPYGAYDDGKGAECSAGCPPEYVSQGMTPSADLNAERSYAPAPAPVQPSPPPQENDITPLVPEAAAPPPVLIDQSARHRGAVPDRLALRRLPRVIPDPIPLAAIPGPIGPPTDQRLDVDLSPRIAEFKPPEGVDASQPLATEPASPTDERNTTTVNLRNKFWLDKIFSR